MDSRWIRLLRTSLRLDPPAEGVEGRDEDDYLAFLLDSAERQTLDYLQRPAGDLADANGDYPLPVTHAIIMLASHAYDQGRETAGPANLREIPYTVEAKLRPYRKLT